MSSESFAMREFIEFWSELGVEVNKNVPKIDTLEDIALKLKNCQKCQLSKYRKNIVFGAGNSKAALMFVGEGPGADEDEQGLPFVGKAGQLLTKIIEAMHYSRNRVYIANVVKCRPPNNRTPLPEEVKECFPFLKKQIEIINPKVIVALGNSAASALLNTEEKISSLRGRFYPLYWKTEICVMPTFHPSYLLRNNDAKKIVWDDMKKVLAKLEEKI